MTGCFEGDGGGPVEGGLEGRTLRFNWKLATDEGPAIAVFGTGAQFTGFWKTNGAEPNAVITVVDVAKKTASTPTRRPRRGTTSSCPRNGPLR